MIDALTRRCVSYTLLVQATSMHVHRIAFRQSPEGGYRQQACRGIALCSASPRSVHPLYTSNMQVHRIAFRQSPQCAPFCTHQSMAMSGAGCDDGGARGGDGRRQGPTAMRAGASCKSRNRYSCSRLPRIQDHDSQFIIVCTLGRCHMATGRTRVHMDRCRLRT